MATIPFQTAEQRRLEQSQLRKVHWKRWGPYLSERQWGTVREDYSADGEAWDYLPFDHARSRAYRWGEDGIGGICDRRQHICFALTLWNGKDPFLKERLFGVSNRQGNHGEDVKEYYFYLDSTPTHSYSKFLYKYPQAIFPYARLVEENRRRRKTDREFELIDTGIFDENRYFDVFIEYAKLTHEDILIRITAHNRGPDSAPLYVLPTVWFRNTWSWERGGQPPRLAKVDSPQAAEVIQIEHSYYGKRLLTCERKPDLLFTENETNTERLWGLPNKTPYVKDGIDDYVIHNVGTAVNPAQTGTKAAAYYQRRIEPGGSATFRLRLSEEPPPPEPFESRFDTLIETRKEEANEFYANVSQAGLSEDARNVQRQAFAGMLWTKQFYHYDVRTWLAGDPVTPPPPGERLQGRNRDWKHLYNADIISMPDKWEYPWYAAWDLAFHCIPLALVDPEYAKEQLILFLREWYMHPSGQIPAYEWKFNDVNPPVHAWAAWRVYKIDGRITGRADRNFLERVFQKLLLNFTWWVNRKDTEGKNVFQGGFLGLDNIGVFDRSSPLPTGGFLEQSDATSWMGMYCLNMLAIALELSKTNRAYSDVASKFFEHFVYIAHAMHNLGEKGIELWDENDGFYYDVLHNDAGDHEQLKVRSMVGLIPLFAVETLEPEIVDALPGFKKRMLWFIENRPEFGSNVHMTTQADGKVRRLLSVAGERQLVRVLQLMLSENEFLSPYGIRSLSAFHQGRPYIIQVDGVEHRVDYEPAESRSHMFGGNSNWRGPVWFPVNFLLIESLQKFHHYFGDRLQVEFPTGSGKKLSLWEVAAELSRRLIGIFLRTPDRRRPVYGDITKFRDDPHWRDLILFHEYFHGDTGEGLGASHQTGWTGLIAKLLDQSGR